MIKVLRFTTIGLACWLIAGCDIGQKENLPPLSQEKGNIRVTVLNATYFNSKAAAGSIMPGRLVEEAVYPCLYFCYAVEALGSEGGGGWHGLPFDSPLAGRNEDGNRVKLFTTGSGEDNLTMYGDPHSPEPLLPGMEEIIKTESERRLFRYMLFSDVQLAASSVDFEINCGIYGSDEYHFLFKRIKIDEKP